ncbi:MAG: ABC transporter ATP-binding protein [Arachnia sp.]
MPTDLSLSAPARAAAGDGVTPPGDRVFGALRILWIAVRREPWVFTGAVLGSLVFGFLTVADATVLSWATNAVVLPAFTTGRIDAPGMLVAVVAVFAGVALLRSVGIVGRWFGAKVMQFRMQAHTRRDVTRAYLRLPLSWHGRHSAGRLMSNASSDVEAAWSAVSELPLALGVSTILVVSVVQMLLIDWPLGIVGLLVFPGIAIATVRFQHLSAPLVARQQVLRADLSDVAHESFDGALVVKALGREDAETARFADAARELRDLGVRIGRLRAVFDPVSEAIPQLGVLAVLLVGAWRVREGLIDPGELVGVGYLLTIVAIPLRSVSSFFAGFPSSVVGYARVRRILEERQDTEHGDTMLPVSGRGARVRVEGAILGYDRGPVLRGIDLDIAPGSTVAIVGETASGKSTLALLLARLLDPDDGVVRIDGTDVRELRRGELAEHVAYVPQNAYLFDDTVRHNVALYADVSDAEILDALRVAQAEQFVAELPQGLDTRLGERGASLSGGQRQRLALARALVRRPRLLILDDVTSAVDADVEARILSALRQAARGATVVMVAHRVSSISLADEAVLLSDGRIAARGPHEQLRQHHDGYRRLVDAYGEAERDGASDESGASA